MQLRNSCLDEASALSEARLCGVSAAGNLLAPLAAGPKRQVRVRGLSVAADRLHYDAVLPTLRMPHRTDAFACLYRRVPACLHRTHRANVLGGGPAASITIAPAR